MIIKYSLNDEAREVSDGLGARLLAQGLATELTGDDLAAYNSAVAAHTEAERAAGAWAAARRNEALQKQADHDAAIEAERKTRQAAAEAVIALRRAENESARAAARSLSIRTPDPVLTLLEEIKNNLPTLG